MKTNFSDLAEKVNNSTFKDIYKLIGAAQVGQRIGVADAATKQIRHSTDDIKEIQGKLYEHVKLGLSADGEYRTIGEVQKGLILNLTKVLERKEGVAADNFYNALTGIGTNIDPGTYNTASIPVSLSPQEATAFYSNGGIPQIIIDKKVDGMMMNGYQFVGTGWEDDELKRLKEHADSLNFTDCIKNTWRDGYIYGGAGGIPWLKGDNPATYQMTVRELASAKMLQKGCIEYFWEVDRWNMVLIPDYDISARDYLSPNEFYVPLAGLSVNAQRMALARPKELPYWGAIRQMGWGISDFASFMPSELAYEIMIASLPIISQQLSLLYSHIPLDLVLAQSGANAVRNLVKDNEEALKQWNMLAAKAFTSVGELKTVERHFTDYDKLILIAKQDVGAKSGLSHTLIFNEMQSGMDEKNYDTTLKEAAVIKSSANKAVTQFQNLTEMLVYSCFGYDSPQGKKAKEVRLSFDSPTVLTNEEKAGQLVALGGFITQATAAGFQLGDAMTLARQKIDFEISEEMAQRIEAFDAREEERDDLEDESMEQGVQRPDSGESKDGKPGILQRLFGKR